MGDGVAIDPVGSTLCAPCDGEVLSVHRAGHAVTLRAVNGAEILMHVGLETVALNGEGFERHVADGQKVTAGDRLISFDLDLLAREGEEPDHAHRRRQFRGVRDRPPHRRPRGRRGRSALRRAREVGQ